MKITVHYDLSDDEDKQDFEESLRGRKYALFMSEMEDLLRELDKRNNGTGIGIQEMTEEQATMADKLRTFWYQAKGESGLI